MADASKLLAGSYRGVELLFSSSSITGGRKTATHSFPNRNTDLIEDLGPRPREYSIDIIITSRPKASYFDYRDNVLSVLDGGGKGDLVHPFYGRISDVVATDYSLNERISEFGSATVSVSFKIDGNRGIPQNNGNFAAKVQQSALETQNKATDLVANGFGVSARFSRNYGSAVDAVDSMVASGKRSLQGVTEQSEDADRLADELSNMASNTLNLLNDPQALAESIGGVFGGLASVYPSAEAAFNGYREFFGFGGDELPAPTTAGLIERANNQAVLDGAINTAALANGYGQAVQVQYTTESEIDAVAEILETQYQLVITGNTDQDLKDALTDMRVDVVAAFNAARLTASKIITVPVQETSVRLLAFDYYGNDNNGQLIAELNDIQDASSISGHVKLVTV